MEQERKQSKELKPFHILALNCVAVPCAEQARGRTNSLPSPWFHASPEAESIQYGALHCLC